jgi:hypothetical protein
LMDWSTSRRIATSCGEGPRASIALKGDAGARRVGQVASRRLHDRTSERSIRPGGRMLSFLRCLRLLDLVDDHPKVVHRARAGRSAAFWRLSRKEGPREPIAFRGEAGLAQSGYAASTELLRPD